MSQDSDIGWCHDTVNTVWGCTEVSEACDFCYAREMDKRRGPMFDDGNLHWGKDAPRWVRSEEAITELHRLDRLAARKGERRRIFINSMSDTFEDHPQLPPARAALFQAAVGIRHLDILLLTKRPHNVLGFVPVAWREKWPAHVWIGTTVECQPWDVLRLSVLLKIPAAVRFVSYEGAIAPVSFRKWLGPDKVNWLICGCESGAKRRPMAEEWARKACSDSIDAGIPFFMKQMARNGKVTADIADFPPDLQLQQFPTSEVLV
jgi:protein gp37